MRPDLNKLLCEHERRGSYRSFRQVRRNKKFADPVGVEEAAAGKEGMRRRYMVTGDEKEFGEFLSPLLGQVRKAVGRSWDSFYGELCRNFDMSTPVNAHILQHLDRYCEREDIQIGEDGQLWVAPRYSRYIRPLKGSHIEFYVDPRDGIIKRNKGYVPWSYRPPHKPDPDFRAIDADHVLRRVAGLWFYYTMGDIPPGEWVTDAKGNRHFLTPSVWDVFHKKFVHANGAHIRLEPVLRYHAAKCSASHKVLKAQGLAA